MTLHLLLTILLGLWVILPSAAFSVIYGVFATEKDRVGWHLFWFTLVIGVLALVELGDAVQDGGVGPVIGIIWLVAGWLIWQRFYWMMRAQYPREKD